MLKIKDYIFNENEILQISKGVQNTLSITLKYSDKLLKINNATFNDIEWNYEDSFVQRLEEECGKLKEENKKFDVIKQLLKQEEKIYGSLTDAGKMILKIIDGEE